MAAHLDPFAVTPRLDVKPWGGRRLAGLLGVASQRSRIGEAVVTSGDVVVATGRQAGATLDDLVRADPIALMGRRGLTATGGRAVFPLLVKLIDADEHLSVQVHPDDVGAADADSLGKTEAWVVLAVADADRSFFAGVQEGIGIDRLADAASRPGAAAELLRRLPARTGESVFLPAGSVHALGAGVMVYELQQPCDVTYRLDDWGRVGIDGAPRELHVAASLAAIDPAMRPSPIAPVALPGLGRRELLVACRYFALDRFTLAAGEMVRLEADDSPQVVTVLEGAVDLRGPSPRRSSLRLGGWRMAVVPAAVGAVEASAAVDSVVLRAWVPDLAADIVAPALAAGVAPVSLSALSAPWRDMDEAIASTRHAVDASPAG